MKQLILASQSPYRKALLSRLQIPFTIFSPEIDETPKPHETWDALVLRLAREKAQSAASRFPDAICIGADSVAALGDRLLTKPHTRNNAIQQLSYMSGQKVYFHVGLCVFAPVLSFEASHGEQTAVTFRTLSPQLIHAYLDKEAPYQSAGSFKLESLGIALIQSFEGQDPTATIGLPLIALCDLLQKAGVNIFHCQKAATSEGCFFNGHSHVTF